MGISAIGVSWDFFFCQKYVAAIDHVFQGLMRRTFVAGVAVVTNFTETLEVCTVISRRDGHNLPTGVIILPFYDISDNSEQCTRTRSKHCTHRVVSHQRSNRPDKEQGGDSLASECCKMLAKFE